MSAPKLAVILLSLTIFLATGCVHRVTIPQGNFLEEDAIEQVETGMTRAQVRYLLGTPMVADLFHGDRWDYVYYIKFPKLRKIETQRISIFFDGDSVARIERDDS